MSLFLQLGLGTLLLALCALVHVGTVVLCIPYLARLAIWFGPDRRPRLRIAILLSAGICGIVAAHTVQIWIWAATFLLQGAFETMAMSFYFATVTYTTLGYGDIVLGEDLRIVATFAAVTGLLTFGISTAFLLGLLVRIMPESFGENR